MAHSITEQCTGCGACAKKCPTQAIAGQAKSLHAVSAALCIDCGVCGNLCPKSAVIGPDGQTVSKRKLSARPKALVDADLCTGCETCQSVCPEACITMEPFSAGGHGFNLAVVNRKRCIGCGLCESICIKEAVIVADGDPVVAA